MINTLKEHLLKYPKMNFQDGIKLIFQATFGANHLIKNKDKSLFEIEKEWTQKRDMPLFEPIGPYYVRANINAFEKNELPLLNLLFIKGAKENCQEIDLSPIKEVWGQEALSEYLKGGIRPVSHSEDYKKEYKPAYRVIPKIYAEYWDIIKRIYFEAPKVIAIDGRAGSGKTTLANTLLELFDFNIIRADHFFLPPQMRTPKRLEEAGGNIHYERLKEQVIDKLGQEFEYDIFDCSQMALNGKKKIINTKPVIIEGSYSLHPHFGEYYDLGIFLSVSSEEQKARILKRNGNEMLQRFINNWIPMEEKYFEAFKIQKKAQINKCLR